MKKLARAFKAFYLIFKRPWLLNKILDDDGTWFDYLQKNHQLKSFPVIKIDTLFPDFQTTLNTFAFLDGGSLPTDIALLKLLAAEFKDCSYFEIGTWRGESVVNVAENATECYTLNLSKQELLTLGLNEKYADLHAFFSKNVSKIIHLEGNSMNYDFASLNKKFDLIFIDGHHHYEYVKNDTSKVFEHLVHEHTVIVWHDYAYAPEKLRPEVIAAILDGTPKAFRKNLFQVSNSMCAIFSRKNYKTHDFSPLSSPAIKFEVKLKVEKIND